MGMTSKKVINLVIVLILIGVLAPVGISAVFNANTDGWDSTTVLVFKLIGTLSVVGLAVGSVYMVASGKD
jgi:hypothetical protein